MKKFFIRIAAAMGVLTVAGVFLIGLAYLRGARFSDVFNFTSSNSALYLVKDAEGAYQLKRNLNMGEAENLVFRVNANGIINFFMQGLAVAKDRPVLELTWNEQDGAGGIKQYLTDGKMLSVSFSRFEGGGIKPKGLFLGGNLPYEDRSRSLNQDSSGFGYFDGKSWYHIWCNSNEAFELLGEKPVAVPPVKWQYISSQVLKNTTDEVILESEHEAKVGDHRLQMKRTASFKAGDNYFTLKVKFTNLGPRAVTYSYSWGDEPWIGGFGASAGDVGWYDEGPIWTEKVISPVRKRYAGYWDVGNEAAGEGKEYSGLANFVEWFTPVPSVVYLSNSFERCCDQSVPLSSDTDRVLNLVWLNQIVLPGKSKTHTLAIGKAQIDPETGKPVKPDTDVF